MLSHVIFKNKIDDARRVNLASKELKSFSASGRGL